MGQFDGGFFRKIKYIGLAPSRSLGLGHPTGNSGSSPATCTSKSCKLMAHSHCMGPGQGQGQGLGNDGFLYYAIYCSHYTGRGTGTGNHCFLLYPSRSWSLFRPRSRAV